jgi:hypothetical protein
MQMRQVRHLVADHAAARARVRIRGLQHVVIDNELTPTIEKIRKADASGGAFEFIVFVDGHPWQPSAFSGQTIAGTGVLLLPGEQSIARTVPFVRLDDHALNIISGLV